MSTALETALAQSLEKDRQALANSAIPMVTVSASFREDVKGFYGHTQNEELPDIVLSRAHYSMAVGTAIKAWGTAINPDKAWLVDPTNYVSSQDWRSIQITEAVGKTLARYPLLKQLKDLIDTFGRQKLPILKSITPPLLYVTEKCHQPILSFHIAAGNILAESGKKVIQVITDPHVRDDYLANVHLPNIKFCVFDERTKIDFLEKAVIRGYVPPTDKVIVTGPPIDPRIIAKRQLKKAWNRGPVRICITTGGLGTNKPEIKTLLEQLLPELRKDHQHFQILVYAGTQKDIAEMVKQMARKERVKVSKITDQNSDLRLIYHPQIVDANELLVKYGFPWADGFISKPSGDMAYDAVAAGCFLLTLAEWGEWEHNIREIFEQKNIARRAQIDNIVEQLNSLMLGGASGNSWIQHAMINALGIDRLFLHGSEHILKATRQAFT